MKATASSVSDPHLSQRERLRRAVVLCREFARNLVYFRSIRKPEHRWLLDPILNSHAAFWRATSNNFLDVCVLEWCKLFADKRAKHHWSKIVCDPQSFEIALIADLGLDTSAFDQHIEAIRRYRDKFVAHLDSDLIMHPPVLDVPKKAVWFYHAHIVKREASAADLAGLPLELDKSYVETEMEADAVYRQAAKAH